MFQVAEQCCNQCLMGPNKIVSDARKQQILDACLRQQTHFTCHKATISGEDICCRGFYESHGAEINKIQVFERLGVVEFVPVVKNEG